MAAGRPLGSKNTDSIQYQEFFVKQEFCIPENELFLLREAKELYLFYKDHLMTGRFSPMEDQACKYLTIYQNQLKEMGSRIYPKLKSIEQIKTKASDNVPLLEQYAAVKDLMKHLEEEIKKLELTP